jgi:IclR family acetate operon transcriptional repressor
MATDMVGKALNLLGVLGEHPEGIAMAPLAREVGYPLSTVHRLLASLARHEFAEVDERTKRWSLGLRVFQLGQRVSHARGFSGVALPILQRVTTATNEATLMAVQDGDHQLFVHYIEGPQQLSVIGEPGKLGPLHCTGQGKALVAFAPEPERARLIDELELVPMTPRTIVDRDAFRAEIETVRRQGWAMADEEHEAGIRAIGVPVLGLDGVAIAAISTAAPAFRVEASEMAERFVPPLRAAARELSALLPSV